EWSAGRHMTEAPGAIRIWGHAAARAAACVQAIEALVGCAPHLGEEVTPRTAHLRPHDAEHQVCRERGIDGAATVAQDVDSGERGEIVRRGHYAVGAVG